MKYVAYYRVSTKMQGLGIEAQAAACRQFAAAADDVEIVGEFSEKESGKMSERPQLAAAIAMCRRRKATLLVAKLDRLTRDVVFGMTLKNSGVEFRALDCPEMNTLLLGIMLSLAQHERELISQRTKAALAALKAQGKKLGSPRGITAECLAAAAAANKERANNAANKKAWLLVSAMLAAGRRQVDCVAALKEGGYLTPRGREWTAAGVARLTKRFGSNN